jgi:hypothetical protein
MILVGLLVGSFYTSSSMFVFVQALIDGTIMCSPQGNGKTYSCASVIDKNGYTTTTYCTTCDDTSPPSNCSPREKPRAVVIPGRDLSNILEGAVLENPNTVGPKFSQKFGEIPQSENNLTFTQANISSGNTSSDILSLGQSDLVSDAAENTTGSTNVEGEENESVRTEEGASEESDAGEDNNDEEQDGDEDDEDNSNEDESAPQ